MPRPDAASERLPIRMMLDRVLVSVDDEKGDRKSGGGILIPATASVGKRLAWASVVATGNAVRHIQVGDRVLFDPEVISSAQPHVCTSMPGATPVPPGRDGCGTPRSRPTVARWTMRRPARRSVSTRQKR